MGTIAKDRNGKVLILGDEVTIHFRVVGFEARSDGEVVNVNLRTIHIPQVEGAGNPELAFDLHPTMVILQRKAKA